MAENPPAPHLDRHRWLALTSHRLLFAEEHSFKAVPLTDITRVTLQQKTFSEVLTVHTKSAGEIRLEWASHTHARRFGEKLAQVLPEGIHLLELPSVASE